MKVNKISLADALKSAPESVKQEIARKQSNADYIRAEAASRLNDNAEFQRRNRMTATERGRGAVDKMTESLIKNERSKGNEVSESEMRNKATSMQEKWERGRG